MPFRIEQQDELVWKVYRGDEVHWARTAQDAVALKLALEAAFKS